MGFNESLTGRVGSALERQKAEFLTKKMFGGICFLVDGKMCVGVNGNALMVRFDPEIYEKILEKEDCREMDFTGRPMRGYVFVDETSLKNESDMDRWIKLALDFNPKAKSSRKKK